MIRCDLDPWHATLYELCRNGSLGTPNILLSEEELTIEIGDIDGVHVDDVDIIEAAKRKVGEDLAAETSGADDENLALSAKKVFDGAPAWKFSSVEGPGLSRMRSMCSYLPGHCNIFAMFLAQT